MRTYVYEAFKAGTIEPSYTFADGENVEMDNRNLLARDSTIAGAFVASGKRQGGEERGKRRETPTHTHQGATHTHTHTHTH